MKHRYSFLLIIVILLISGCFTKEEKPSQNGTLKIGALEMLAYDSGTPSNGRTNETSTWKHVFKSQATLEIKNTLTQQEYALVYDPNDFGGNYQLSLPYGNYTYGSVVTGNDYENFLPYEVSGTFSLDTPALEISLKAKSTYGLITVENNHIQSSPILVDTQQIPMNLLGDYYYKYVKKGKAPVLEIVENVFQNTIRRSITVEAYKHYNYAVRVSDGSGRIINLLMTDFELVEEELLVNTGEVPSSYNLTFITNNAAEVRESSGLAYINGELWTHNDSGHENIIYKIDKTNGTVLHRVRVSNGQNVDWESLAQSETHLFVGDFGNNSGFRKDLVIYKIDKNELHKNEVTAEKIFFSFPDQTDFTPRFNNQDFDCEAFFFAHDKLHLFSKNWVTSTTRYYTLPSTAGEYSANLETSFDTQGMVTGADINQRTGDIVLVGYTNQGFSTRSFVWLLSGYPDFRIFEGKKNRMDLGSPATLGLTEGIVLKDDNSGYISSETITVGGTTIPSKLFSFDFKAYF